MEKLVFLILVIGYILAFIKIESYFIYKSRESFRALKQAYIEVKKAKQNLHNLLKIKEL